jgi:CHAT domain-containing protein/tetratricopeptide (TPR) repeat protein
MLLRIMHTLSLLLVAGLGVAAAADRFPPGVVVEEVQKGRPASFADVRPGDVLDVASPFELAELGLEQLPRGPVRLNGARNGEPFAALVPTEAVPFGLKVRPAFPSALLEDYERGRSLLKEGKLDDAVTAWRSVTTAAAKIPGGAAAACWLLGRIGAESTLAGRFEDSRAFYREAVACAEPLGAESVALLLEEQAFIEKERGQIEAAHTAYTAALERRETSPHRMARASCIARRAWVDFVAGRSEQAIAGYQEALAIQQKEVPDGIASAESLGWIGHVYAVQGNYDPGQDFSLRSLELAERVAPHGITRLRPLTALGGIAISRGDFALTEHYWRRQLEAARELDPESRDTMWAQNNLGALAHNRGDLDAAEDWYRRTLPLAQKIDPQGRGHAELLRNLAEIALVRGKYATAEELLKEAVPFFEKRTPGHYLLVQALVSWGDTLRMQGRDAQAKPIYERALAMCDQGAVGTGAFKADLLMSLGDFARDAKDWDAAEGFYQKSLAIREGLGPASVDMARALHGIGTVRLARGRDDEAASFFDRAIEAVEAHRGRIGGSDEARSLFVSQFYGIYHDQIDLMLTRGRVVEAFHVLEKARARSLVALMAERDLSIEDELPRDVVQQRQQLDADYERAKEGIARLDPEQDAAKVGTLTSALRDLRDKQAGLAERIRAVSPRIKDLRYPEPLDADGARAALTADSVLLSYCVGKTRTIVFVLSAAGRDGLRAFTIPIGEARLRTRIESFRRLVEKTVPPAEFDSEARALYDLLLRPAERWLQPARVVLLSLDGALHRLPFAALRRPEGFVAQWKPLAVVPSATAYAQLARPRPREETAGLVAFGDPVYPAGRFESIAASRREVEVIGRLFPKALVYAGADATEERAKAVGKHTRYVHFACHGLIDDRFPLDSALALTIRDRPDKAEDNGLLHAWEIFERVRVEADIVTLSACRTAAGSERAGEGLLGLTRAFQFAGARSVLASLWSIGDKSNAEFMTRFYAALKAGKPGDEALRQAQLAAIRAGWHPVRWAAFQLYGAPGPRATGGGSAVVDHVERVLEHERDVRATVP